MHYHKFLDEIKLVIPCSDYSVSIYMWLVFKSISAINCNDQKDGAPSRILGTRNLSEKSRKFCFNEVSGKVFSTAPSR